MSVFGFEDSGSGDFKAHVRFDAKEGTFMRADRVQTADGWETKLTDLSGAIFIADAGRIRVGWINYTAKGPIKTLALVGGGPPPKPSDPDAKPGVEMDIILHKSHAGGTEGVREWSSTAKIVRSAFEDLYIAWRDSPEGKEGKVPVVEYTGKRKITSQMGSFYKPGLRIVSWIDRPPALQEQQAAAARTTAGNGTQPLPWDEIPATGSTKVNAPQPTLATSNPAPVKPVAADFG